MSIQRYEKGYISIYSPTNHTILIILLQNWSRPHATKASPSSLILQQRCSFKFIIFSPYWYVSWLRWQLFRSGCLKWRRVLDIIYTVTMKSICISRTCLDSKYFMTCVDGIVKSHIQVYGPNYQINDVWESHLKVCFRIWLCNKIIIFS